MGQVAHSIEPEIRILHYDVASDSTSFKTVCLSQFNKEAFCFVSGGVAIINERILDFHAFESALQHALLILKMANRSEENIRDSQFLIGGLEFPINATIEEFCDSENRFDFTMTFNSPSGEAIHWISMGESTLEYLLNNF
jgi:hypothetical protein